MPRYFVRFPERRDRADASRMLDLDAEKYEPFYPMRTVEAERVLIADLSDEERQTAERNGCEVFEDVQFYPIQNKLAFPPVESAYCSPGLGMGVPLSTEAPAMAPWLTKTVNDVMEHIHAPNAWLKSRGADVTIGIVDTGISSAMPEFPTSKRSPFSKSYAYATPWNDPKGHGSMCACAAAATDADGGKFNGVAPDALLMSLRTTLASTDIYKLYEWVIVNKKAGNFPGPVVMSNSYGLYTCSPPAGLPSNHPYYDIVKDAVSEGIPVIFAAGNNHFDALCNHDPSSCGPNSIWAVNSADEVMSIGTVNWDNEMDSGQHANSSRGPGQWATTTTKPDCVAPTYGEIIWGSGYQKMEWWGTSGACPQVAGLVALLLSMDQSLTPTNLYDAIRASCDSLPLGANCAGAGIINCEAAVNSIP